jgi:hypothetical protein
MKYVDILAQDYFFACVYIGRHGLDKSSLVFHIPRRDVFFQGGMSLSPCFVLSTYLQGRGFGLSITERLNCRLGSAALLSRNKQKISG